MKKIKVILALLVLMVVVTTECSVAQAATPGVTVIAKEVKVRELSATELAAVQRETATGRIDGVNTQLPDTRASYTAYEHAQSFEFYVGEQIVARADASCIVYHYTDGKVHLYRRTIDVLRILTYQVSRTYGSIVNTDGSLSYTTGDRVGIYGDMVSWTYAIDFRATPTVQEFSCYQVD